MLTQRRSGRLPRWRDNVPLGVCCQTRSISSREALNEKTSPQRHRDSTEDHRGLLCESLCNLCVSVVKFHSHIFKSNNSIQDLQSIESQKILITLHRPPTRIRVMVKD